MFVSDIPGTRNDYFYAPAQAEAEAVAVDEATNDVLCTTEAAGSMVAAAEAGPSQSIGVPVLMVYGAFDTIFICAEAGPPCTAAALHAQEGPYFSPAARLQVFVLPAAGYSLNLFPNAHLAWDAVTEWADTFVGRG